MRVTISFRGIIGEIPNVLALVIFVQLDYYFDIYFLPLGYFSHKDRDVCSRFLLMNHWWMGEGFEF